MLSNIGKLKAFLKVGKSMSFPLDLPSYLPEITRTEQCVEIAQSAIELPMDQIKHSMFWFMKLTPLDEVAFKNLFNGNIAQAKDIWSKKDGVSSQINLMVCGMIEGDITAVAFNADKLFQQFGDEYCKIVNETVKLSSSELTQIFIDTLKSDDEFEMANIANIPGTSDTWQKIAKSGLVAPLIEMITTAIADAKSAKGPQANYNAGVKLMNSTKEPLLQLKSLLGISDMQYQMTADKLAQAILQCGINYFNDSEDDDAPQKAMTLQGYALSIAVGQMAKDRCKENIRVLADIISKLPPLEVIADHKAINSAISQFNIRPDLISYSIQLIKDCAPHVVAIKERLGKTHKYYLQISTKIVNLALGNIITEVNKAQSSDFNTLKIALISAWRAQLYLDMFDLDPEYKKKRYNECREALHEIISKCKGFESSVYSSMYQYGCGWCNNIDCSDIDMRTEEEYYKSCSNLASYQSYLKKYPYGKYVIQAQSKIEFLTFQASKTIAAFEAFIQKYPNSEYIARARKNIEILIQQEKALSACKTTDEVVALYESDKADRTRIDADKYSLRAYQLSKSKDDYRKVISIFGSYSTGGQNSEKGISEIEENRKKVRNRALWISVPLLILLSGFFIWGITGIVVSCAIIAYMSLLFAFAGGLDRGCSTFFIFAAVAVVFGLLAAGLYKFKQEDESKKLYEQIINNPSEESCIEYIQQFNNTDNANNVRNIWLHLLLDNANTFDYDSFNDDFFSSSSSNPIIKLQEFIKRNDGTIFSTKALSTVDSICDSLYKVANKKSTVAGWKQYQKLVPTDYFRDSETKIEDIENQAWNTESKAWKIALSENTISAYTKYKSLYPNGAHIALCEKNLIDLEVARVYAGDHGSLPELEQTGYGGGTTSFITVTNSTSYVLTLLYSGPDSKRLVIPAGGTSSVRLKNGRYKIAASVSASNVSNYAGSESLQGGSYSANYYISSSRY